MRGGCRAKAQAHGQWMTMFGIAEGSREYFRDAETQPIAAPPELAGSSCFFLRLKRRDDVDQVEQSDDGEEGHAAGSCSEGAAGSIG